jgi:hypothetical protein
MQKSNWIRISLAGVMLAGAVLACNLPGNNVQPTPSAPTPNLTMTALFSIVTKAPPISTPVSPGAATATSSQFPAATSTQPPISGPTISLTPLPLVTNTPQPTADPRPAGRFEAKYMSTPPVLDGKWDEWSATAYPARFIVFGKENWADKADLEGSFRVGWDSSNLYLATKVYDESYVQNATDVNLFKGDSVELLMDVDLPGDINSIQLTSDDYQLVFSPGMGGVSGIKETYLYNPANVAGPRTTVKIASIYEGGIIRMEIAVPWSVLGITPAAGKQFGFALSVNDNDISGQNVQQTMASSIQGRDYRNPTSWGLLELKN